MGRLAGFNYRKIAKRLKKASLSIVRPLARIKIWYKSETGRYTTIPNHPGDVPDGTLKAILNQAGVATDEFLSDNNKLWPARVVDVGYRCDQARAY